VAHARMGWWIAMMLIACAGGCGKDPPPRGGRDAGTRPDTGPPPGRDAGPDGGPSATDPAVLARAAVVLSSCLGGSAGARLLDALGTVTAPSGLGHLLREHAVCLATTGTGCDALDTCLGIELDVPGECTAGCDGTTAVICGASHVRWRCADTGLTCAEGQCLADGAACTESACEGDVPRVCLGTVAERGPSCAEHALDCVHPLGEGVDGGVAAAAGCRGPGGDCTSTVKTTLSIDFLSDAIECVDADRIATCINDGRHEMACSDLLPGLSCRTTSDVERLPFCGLSNECNPLTAVVEYCSGTELVVCNLGRLDRVSCSRLGFSRCTTGRCA